MVDMERDNGVDHEEGEISDGSIHKTSDGFVEKLCDLCEQVERC